MLYLLCSAASPNLQLYLTIESPLCRTPVLNQGSLAMGSHRSSHNQSSSINLFWAELQEMHTLLLALASICSLHSLSTGHVAICCDTKGVRSLVQWPRSYISCWLKHHDLLRAILNTCCSCPLLLSFQYIAGHQDDFSQFEDLPLLAQLNIQANSLAKQALHILGTQRAPPLLSSLPNAS